MKTVIATLIALGTFSASALDLTPNFAAIDSDGVVLINPYFKDGAKKYGVLVNMDTELTAYGDGARFKFTKLDHAEMILRHSPLGVNVKFGPDTVEAYEQAARKLLPQLAEGVTLEKQVKNPLPMNAWESHRFVFKYSTPAGVSRESITFLNILPGTQVVIQVYAKDAQFENATEHADDVIRRWYELDEQSVLRGN
jgi:hypothetical protein